MTKDYLWIFNDSALASGLDGAFSLEYNIPSSKLSVPVESLVGSRIWLMVKKDDRNFLYAFVNPSVIELYQEGKYKGDFLVRCEPFSSVRLLPRHEQREPWSLPFNGGDGVRECTESEQVILLETLEKNRRVGFSPPSHTILDVVPRTAFVDLENSVMDQFMSAVRTLAFGDLSHSRLMPESISALGGAVMEILKSTHPDLNEVDVVSLIASLDPLAKAVDGSLLRSSKEISRTVSSLPPMVDTFLEEIDPEKISPRTFVARSADSSLEWLDKTNDAERAHEQILKDLVLHLKSEGFKVYKTRSFDLFAKKGDNRLLWEIKSASRYNAVSQGEKGIVQLLRYSVALSNVKDIPIRFILLLQDSGLPAAQDYLSKMAARTGSELFLYSAGKDWPQKICDPLRRPLRDL